MAGGLLVGALWLLHASPASAILFPVTFPSFPDTTVVGETFAASLGVVNNSTPPEVQTLSFGAISLVPACATTAPPQDCAGQVEAGVFQLSATGSGAAGPPSCIGTWTITEISPGTFRFTPPGGEGTLALNPGEQCLIGYTVTTVRVPTVDIRPAMPGVQTAQQACGSVTNPPFTVRNCASDLTTVSPAQPSIATAVGPSPRLGGTSTDTAVLTAPPGAAVPPAAAPTGNITFRLYGPFDPTCAGPPNSTSTVPVNHFGAPFYPSAPSNPILTPGTYTWVASYSGDANYLPTVTACGDPAETFTVVPPTPTIVTQAGPVPQLGGTSTDSATLSAPAGVTVPPAPAPTGTITFQLYGPSDPTCAGPVHSTSTVPVFGFGSYQSSRSNPILTLGTYTWVARYSGDANYAPVGPTACNDPSETFTVAAPSIRVDKTASPLSRPAPGGDFTFTVVVTNTGGGLITIDQLNDDIYGNLATRPGSTCGPRIGTTLASGASSPPCSFTGSFLGTAGQSQTDVVTVVGHTPTNFIVTDNDDAVVTITEPGPTGSPVGVFRPFNSTWYFLNGGSLKWGVRGDIAVPADYNGDGRDDVAVFRPSNGVWYVRGGATVQLGKTGDIPVPGDYNGDGTDEMAVYRPATGDWYVGNASFVHWGIRGDVPVPADYNGDGADDIAVFRPSNGVWHVRDIMKVPWGTTGDIPVPADYNGDHIDEVAVFRPSTGVWLVRNGPTVAWGTAGDIPVADDYDRNGTDDIAVFRPSTGMWYIRNGPSLLFGRAGDDPLPLQPSIRERYFP